MPSFGFDPDWALIWSAFLFLQLSWELVGGQPPLVLQSWCVCHSQFLAWWRLSLSAFNLVEIIPFHMSSIAVMRDGFDDLLFKGLDGSLDVVQI